MNKYLIKSLLDEETLSIDAIPDDETPDPNDGSVTVSYHQPGGKVQSLGRFNYADWRNKDEIVKQIKGIIIGKTKGELGKTLFNHLDLDSAIKTSLDTIDTPHPDKIELNLWGTKDTPWKIKPLNGKETIIPAK